MFKMTEISKWILYNIVVCFAVYWLSNLILWYPWSLNETLGQVLMLTINPLLWGIASYRCIVRYPGSSLIKALYLNSLVFIIEAMASDLIFFGIIRRAMNKLMHITTIYAWGFVLTLPFIIFLVFRKQIVKNKRELEKSDFRNPVLVGLISFIAIRAIILFNIRFI